MAKRKQRASMNAGYSCCQHDEWFSPRENWFLLFSPRENWFLLFSPRENWLHCFRRAKIDLILVVFKHEMDDPVQAAFKIDEFIQYAKDVENSKRYYDDVVRCFIGNSFITDNTDRFQHLFLELDRGYKNSKPESDNLLSNGKGMLWFHLDVYCSISARPHPKVIQEITDILRTLAIEKGIY